MSMNDLYEMNDADFEQAGYEYQRAAEAAKNAQVVNPLEDLSDDELMRRWQEAARKELAKRREQDSFDAARQFVSERPEYIESQKNAKLIEQYLGERLAADETPTVDHIHEAFDALSKRGLLEVRVLPREPRPVLSNDDLYNIDLDELADLARNPGAVRRVR